jgi:predicted RNA-binding protein YlqC (UPF0109 family)
MTPDTDRDASTAHDFIHALVLPLIPHDPTGIGIKVNANEIILLASARNMGSIIGKGGTTVAALRQLLKPFGWHLQVPSNARADLYTPPINPAPEVRELVLGWLDARYTSEAYRLEGEPEGKEWTVHIHPDFYDHADYSAIETFAYCASRAQGSLLKVRLKAGGVIRE